MPTLSSIISTGAMRKALLQNAMPSLKQQTQHECIHTAQGMPTSKIRINFFNNRNALMWAISGLLLMIEWVWLDILYLMEVVEVTICATSLRCYLNLQYQVKY